MFKLKLNLFALLLISLFFVGAVSAQNSDRSGRQKKTPEERAKKISDKMNEKLSLTSSQYSSVYSLFLNHFSDMQKYRSANPNKDRSEMKDYMKQNREEMKKQLTAILTQDQLNTWQSLKKEKHKGKGKGKNKDRSGTKKENRSK